MAISNLRLNVAANTSRALADFGKFSQSLDNKFLVSGLKLDFVRSALSQINRDFTRAIGEQGLASASSLRAAQNQAALLTQTFKGFSVESSLAISTNIGTALNNVAVKAGGTMKDVQKTLAATPFISTRIGEDMRQNLTKGMMAFQRDMRRAGLGDNFGGVAQQFLMGRSTGMQLIESGDPMAAFLGSEIVKRAGGEGYVFDPAERSRIMADIVGNKQISEQLELMAKRTYGFRIILEDLNTYLFNPEAGVFGSLRKVVDSAGNTTTMFDEVEKLTESVFGETGMFAKLVKAIRSVFGDYDPMRPFIDGVQLMRRVFDEIGRYFQTSGFQRIVEVAKDVVDGVTKVFKGLYEQIGSGNFDPDSINEGITSFNESLRDYIKQLGQMIRGEDVSKQSEFTGSVLGTLVEEIGKTSIVLIKELFATFIDKVPEIATKVLPALNDGINKMLTEVFGNELAGKVLKFVLGFVPGPVGQIARASTAGDLTGGGGNILSMLAMGGAALLGTGLGSKIIGGVGSFGMGAGRLGFGLARTYRSGGANIYQNIYGRGEALEQRVNAMRRGLFMDETDFLTRRMQRFAPRSGIRLPSQLSAITPISYQFPMEGMMGPSSQIGRISARTSALAGSIPYETPSSRIFQSRMGRITPETTILGGPMGYRGPSRITPQTTMFQPPTGAELFPFIATGGGEERERRLIDSPYERERRRRVIEEYKRRYSFRNRALEELRYMSETSESDAVPGYIDRGRANVASRFNRRYGSGGTRAILGRGIRRFGRGALVTGALAGAGALGLGIFGGPGANAQTMEGFNAAGSVLGGGLEGAMTGAAIGSIIPGIGTAAGAVIGGVIGGVAPLMDKGVRDSIGKLIKDISTGFGNTAEWFITGTKENFGRVMDSLGSMFKSFTNGFISVLNIALTGFQILPRVIMGMVEIIYNKTPGLSLIPGLGDAVNAGKSLVNFQIPNFASGKDYAGPAMALEARMSGRRPMVVNDGEFVIPKDGFPILAGLVGQNLLSTGVIGSANNSTPTQVNVTLSLTAHSVVANADELVETMREPVYKIIADAIREAENSRISRTPTV
jgi:hypothetical protein